MILEEQLLELMKITSIKSIEELKNNLIQFKSNIRALKEFYLCTGRFPEPIEDKFIYEHGFSNWYNAFNAGILKNL